MSREPLLGAPTAWRIPRQALRLAVPVSLGLLIPLIAAYLLAGTAGVLAVTLGYSGCLFPALMLRSRIAACLTVPIAMAGAVGVELNGQALPAACFAALACLLVAPANVLSNGVLAGLPTVAAVAVATPTRLDPSVTFTWMLGAGLIAVLLVTFLRPPALPSGIPAIDAWSHAVAMAASVGLAVFVVTWAELPRGFWVPMTMTVVLRPLAAETRRVALQRISGTVLGAVVAVMLTGLFSGWVVAAVGLSLLVALVSYGLLDRSPQQVAVLTPLIIVLGSGGTVAALGLAVERVAYTAIGVLLAGSLSVLLIKWREHGVTESASGPRPAPETD